MKIPFMKKYVRGAKERDILIEKLNTLKIRPITECSLCDGKGKVGLRLKNGNIEQIRCIDCLGEGVIEQ